MRISIGHQIFEVKEGDPGGWDRDAMGRAAQMEGILINRSLPESVKASTLLHEITHLIADIHLIFEIGNEEARVRVLANAMFAFLRDPINREAVSMILGESKDG